METLIGLGILAAFVGLILWRKSKKEKSGGTGGTVAPGAGRTEPSRNKLK